MRTVYKYKIPLCDEFKLELAKTISGFHIGLDPNGDGCLWCFHETEEEKEQTKFYVRGTGHNVPDDAEYLGSWVDSVFVWHLFIAADQP